MRSGLCFERPTLAPATDASDSTSWPTVTDSDSRSSARHTTTTGVMHPGTMLTDAIRQWPTPGVVDGEQAVAHKGSNPTLHGLVMDQWATPVKRDYRSGLGTQKRDGAQALPEQVTRWPTPSAEPYGSSQNGIGWAHERPSANTPSLERLSRSFLPLLPTSTDGELSSPSDSTSRLPWKTPRVGCNVTSEKARREFSSTPGLAQQAAGSASLKGKPKLNPQFVEWLMGWPIGWTASELAATEWCRWRQRMRSSLCAFVRSGGLE